MERGKARGRERTWRQSQLPGLAASRRWARSPGFAATQPPRAPSSALPGAGATDLPACMHIVSRCVDRAAHPVMTAGSTTRVRVGQGSSGQVALTSSSGWFGLTSIISDASNSSGFRCLRAQSGHAPRQCRAGGNAPPRSAENAETARHAWRRASRGEKRARSHSSSLCARPARTSLPTPARTEAMTRARRPHLPQQAPPHQNAIVRLVRDTGLPRPSRGTVAYV